MKPGTRGEFEQALHINPNATQAELATMLKISPSMVYRRLKAYEMTTAPQRGMNSISRDALETALAEYPGITHIELAVHFDVCKSTIGRVLIKHGLETDRSSLSSAQVYAEFESGATTPDTMKKRLGITWSAARNWMVKLGLLEGSEERASIRNRLPACRACGDPVDPDDPTWGGVGAVHYTCVLLEFGRRMINVDDIEKLLAEINRCDRNGLCFDCKAPIEHEEQVGRCVYAHPCGHRRGQGKARTQVELEQCRIEREKEHR